MRFDKLNMFIRLLTCALILVAVAVQQSGKIVGHKIVAEETEQVGDVISGDADSYAINTESIANDIKGYGGDVPLKITVESGKIKDIEALENSETPSFFEPVKETLLPQYIGMTPEEVLNANIDGVTGATYSSKAVIATMQRAMTYADSHKPEANNIDTTEIWSIKFFASLVVVLMGAILPIFIRNPKYRIVQLLLNIIVLGFWCGTFLSYSLFVNYLSNGFNPVMAVTPIILLIVAFIYPFFGRKSHYCMWQCPLGSLQEIAGKCVKYKLKISGKVQKYLNYFHDGLWIVLMLFLMIGIWSDWMGYELFTAFMFQQASWIIVAVAVFFVIMSFFVQRPYCRYICPTGNLFQLIQNKK
jgi:uncharacterized protein with FMN-binding domain